MDDVIRGAADAQFRLVFPSEVAAAWWRREAVIRRGRPVWEQQFASWDRFKEQAFSIRSELIPCNAAIRRAFAEAALAENAAEPFLRRLVPPATAAQTAAAQTAFVPLVVRALPGLARFLDLPDRVRRSLPEALTQDVTELNHRYRRFLDRHGLYETGDVARTAELQTHERWLLVSPELADDYPEFAARLSHLERVTSSQPAAGSSAAGSPSSPRLHRFATYPEELRWVLAQIGLLLDAGTDPESIAVTVGELSAARERVLEEAQRYEVPLRLREGVPLAETAPGRLFSALGALSERDHSIDAVKALLLEPGVPWLDAAANRRIVARLIADGRLSGFRIPSAPIVRAITSLTRAATFRELRSGIYRFLTAFVDPDGWAESSAAVVQRCVEELNGLIQVEESVGISVANPYRFWIDQLATARYAPRHRGEGVSVYPYRVSALIYPKHHFVMGATARATAVRRAPFPWLTDPEIMSAPELLSERDLSVELMQAYTGSGATVTVTWSDASVHGPALPPAWLVASGASVGVREPEAAADPYQEEREQILSLAEGGPVFPLQQDGSAELARTYPARASGLMEAALTDSDAAAALRRRLTDTEHPDVFRLSASHVSAFANCPFSFALSYGLGVRETDYEIDPDNARQIGELYHRALERYYRELQTDGLSITEEPAADAQQRLRRHADAVFAAPGAAGMLSDGVLYARRQLFDRIAEWVVATDREHFRDHRPLLVEGWRARTDVGGEGANETPLVLFGRVDRVTEAPDRMVAIIDYKKGNLPTHVEVTAGSDTAVDPDTDPAGQLAALTQPQLPFYALLLRGAGRLVGTLGYYSLEHGTYGAVADPRAARPWMSGERLEQVLALTERLIANVAARIRAGDYTAAAIECERCAFRPVCRTRFVVR